MSFVVGGSGESGTSSALAKEEELYAKYYDTFGPERDVATQFREDLLASATDSPTTACLWSVPTTKENQLRMLQAIYKLLAVYGSMWQRQAQVMGEGEGGEPVALDPRLFLRRQCHQGRHHPAGGVLGHAARGDPDGPALNRVTGACRARRRQGRTLRRRPHQRTRRIPAGLRVHGRHVRRRHPPAPLSRRRLQTPGGAGDTTNYGAGRARAEDLLPAPPRRHLVRYPAGRRANRPPSRYGSRSVYGNVSGVSCEA